MTTNLPCPDCGTDVSPDDQFCEACGGGLGVQAPVDGCAACGATEIDQDGFCARCGFRRPAARDRIDLDLPGVAGVSDRGLRHEHNEDAIAVRRVDGCGEVVVVVSDGVSTSDNPEDASAAAVEAAADTLVAALREGDDPARATRSAVVAAASAVAELVRDKPSDNAPACTIVSAVVSADRVTVGWVGDSRAYWLDRDPDAPSSCLTIDDSWATQMVAAGLADEETAFADSRAHALTAWLGADAGEVRPHTITVRPTGPGVVLVCSDGLWNYLWDADSLAAQTLPLAMTAPLASARALTRFALERGGHDNITVAVVPFPPRPASTGSTQE
ncbi:hypothetical protein F0L68_28750 [Solihabitans fulvus]|uniref:PPM-type phosphatase domain-containing protein n=1 Tax=Solihabitans fulvus TaxID=1892852 RepID=A0A5B2WWB0_9PSEU|nr:protein phosphatase 2C domain-containing protein [Solihabitans fulvus]KAA2255214.1 hypothetical protein F0L68_28750 [Solihabitans fulvus]